MISTGDIILVTGGTGFLGSRVVRSLLRHRFRVRILANSPPPGGTPPDGVVEYRIADIRDAPTVRQAMQGVGAVCHLAAMVSGWSADRHVMESVNAGGTRTVANAALEAGVRLCVHVSSGSAIEYRGTGILDERSIVPRSSHLTDYGASKLAAENEIRSAGARGLRWVIVYPTRVFGSGTLGDANAAVRFLSLRLRGRLPFLPGGGEMWANWAYADDVAEGIVLALLGGRHGERYILGGENATLRQFFSLAESITARPRVTIPVPHRLGRLIANAEHARALLSGGTPRLTRKWYDAFCEETRLSTARAERKLGYRATPLPEALQEVIGWLVHSHTLEGGNRQCVTS
jgi:farnesol dehydrogenase